MENQELNQLRLEYQALQREHKKQSRELNLLKLQVERSKISAEAKDNMNRVISARRSELERYLQLLMDNFPDIVLLFDRKNCMVYGTVSFLKQCRIPAFSVIRGMHYRKLLSPFGNEEFLNRTDKAFSKVWDEKHMVELTEVIDFSRTGNPRNYNIQIAPMLSNDGVVEGAMALFYDYTELFQAQKEAEHANAAKSDFLATVSHEIRTPINAIIGFTSMLKNTDLNNKQRGYLSNVEKSSQVLLNLINDILDFSKIEAGKLDLIKEYFMFENLLKHIESMFNMMFEQKDIEFSCNFEPDLPKVIYGDETRIRQILTNLLNNAYKYTPSGQVVFSVKVDNNENLCFTVQDTGIGIKQEELPKLFNAFEQLDVVRNKRVKGTGLGLAITKWLCEMMDGFISVESEYGKGSIFTVNIPLVAGAENDLPEEYHVDAISFTAPDAKVLLVDDIEVNLEVADYMISIYKISVDWAYNGVEAVKKAKAYNYDMIFMDHMMPLMDGVEAAGIIRSQDEGNGAYVPIIALTANAVSGMEKMFMENGFNGFLSKPIDGRALEKSIINWLPKEKVIIRE